MKKSSSSTTSSESNLHTRHHDGRDENENQSLRRPVTTSGSQGSDAETLMLSQRRASHRHTLSGASLRSASVLSEKDAGRLSTMIEKGLDEQELRHKAAQLLHAYSTSTDSSDSQRDSSTGPHVAANITVVTSPPTETPAVQSPPSVVPTQEAGEGIAETDAAAVDEHASPDTLIPCQICEEQIPQAEMEEHAISCLIVNHTRIRVVASDEAIKTALAPISALILGTYQKDQVGKGKAEPLSSEEGDLLRRVYSETVTITKKKTFFQSTINQLDVHMKKLEVLEPAIDSIIRPELQAHIHGLIKLCRRKCNLVRSGVSAHLALSIQSVDANAAEGTGAQGSVSTGNNDQGSKGGGGAKKHLMPGIGDFEFIKAISRGAFGQVFLVRKKNTEDYYAMKVIKKDQIQDKNHIVREQDILSQTHHDFVVKLLYSFESPNNLYFVMEYLNGGDVLALLESVGALDSAMVKQYVAETVLAVEHLHSHGIIHRDLKPDNLLIDKEGHLKLTDFGLSRRGADSGNFWGEAKSQMKALRLQLSSTSLDKNKALETILAGGDGSQSLKEGAGGHKRLAGRRTRDNRSCVGTPDYVAPEVLLGQDYDWSADWWALGCITYELFLGAPPFNDYEPNLVFKNILSGHIDWPDPDPEDDDDIHNHPDAIDFIRRLLTLNRFERLGANGAQEIKAHPFLRDIDWETIRKVPAIFVPTPENIEDTSYFDSRGDSSTNDAEMAQLMQEASLAREIESEPGMALNPFAFKNLAVLSEKNDYTLSSLRKASESSTTSDRSGKAMPSPVIARGTPPASRAPTHRQRPSLMDISESLDQNRCRSQGRDRDKEMDRLDSLMRSSGLTSGSSGPEGDDDDDDDDDNDDLLVCSDDNYSTEGEHSS